MNEFEYFLLFSSGIPNVPAVILDDEMKRSEIMIEEPIGENVKIVKLKFWEPYPKKPVMVDFHTNRVIKCISDKIFNVIRPIKIEGIQLVPATILDPRNNVVYDNYYYFHIYNLINCMDKDNSECKTSRTGSILSIVKMRLNLKELEKVPLEKRLIFKLGEMFTFQLFHKSVVEAIMATNPQGLRFVNVNDYHVGSAFD